MYVTYSDLIQTGISDAIFCEILHHRQKVVLFPDSMLALI